MRKFQSKNQNSNKKVIFLEPLGVALTPREAQCFHLLGYGGSVKTIARALELSPRTIEMYINNLKDKTGIPYKSELTRKAIELLMS